MDSEVIILKVGMRVKSIDSGGQTVYTGTCTHVSIDRATIKRDDGQRGGGFNGDWSISRNLNGTWNPDAGRKLVVCSIDDWQSELSE